MSSSTSIIELARAIVKDATILDEHLRSKGLQQPSFDQDGPDKLAFDNTEALDAQERLLSSTKELHHLTLGPANSLRLALNSVSKAIDISIHRHSHTHTES